MEVERVFKCDKCGKESIYAKVWIKWVVFHLCKECHDKEAEKD